MNYLVAVLPNQIKAEAAYSALEQKGLPIEQINILGKGYKSTVEYGLLDLSQQARKEPKRLFYWLMPFEFIAGYAFNHLTSIEIFPVAAVGNHIIGGLLGAASAALGAYLVGGGVGLTTGSGDSLVERNRLGAGKYLIVV